MPEFGTFTLNVDVEAVSGVDEGYIVEITPIPSPLIDTGANRFYGAVKTQRIKGPTSFTLRTDSALGNSRVIAYNVALGTKGGPLAQADFYAPQAGASVNLANIVQSMQAAVLAGGRPGNKTVWLGDSLTQWQDANASFAQRVSLANLGSVLSKQRIRYGRNTGIGGDTTTQMLARFDTDVTPFTPDVVHLLGGTNDTALTVDQSMANITAIVAKIRALGAVPAIGTLPPKNNVSTAERGRISALSTAIRRYAEVQGIILVDYHRLMMDPTTGGILPAYTRSGDDVHPSDAGFVAMGQQAADTLGPFLPAWEPPLATDNTSPNNLIANGLYLNSGGGYPTSFSGAGAQTGLSHSIITGDTTIKGNWHRMDCVNTAATTQLFQNIATAPVPGHRYLFTGRIKAGWTSGADFLTIRNRITTSGSVDYSPLLNVSVNIADGTFYSEYVCPSGATSQQISIILSAGTGYVQTAQLTLYDLTAMGAA